MDHAQFKTNQIAAIYVANGLDAATQEAFELHMMSCAECLEDVEAWRAIKMHMPRKKAPAPVVQLPTRTEAVARRSSSVAGWRLAASFFAFALLGTMGGWY